MSHPARRALILAPIVTLFFTLIGCSSGEQSKNEQEPEAKPTPLSEFDSSSVVITRTDFCDFVPAEAVEAAVGADPTTDHHGNGSQIDVDGGKDLSHEFSCAWTGAEGTAQAWVFVPRLTEARAKALVKDQRSTKGCRLVEGSFGDPGIGTLCKRDGESVASYRGLFVDSWVTCTLERSGTKDKRLVQLTGEWCVAAAKAAGQTA